MNVISRSRLRGLMIALAGTALLVAAGGWGKGLLGTGADPPAPGIRIAIVTRDFTNPYWAALRDGALAEGRKQGVAVNVQAGGSETDSAGENAKLSTLAGQHYDCFGVVPVNATNVITPLVPVARRNIPIVNLDTQIDPETSRQAGITYASFIGSDNLAAGELAATALARRMGGHGDVAILQGIAGERNGINRQQGFDRGAGGALNVVASQPADYDQAKAQTVTDAILKSHPEITGIFAANDTMGLGAAQSVRNAGLDGQVSIISVDGITAALGAVKSGTLSGTVAQYPYVEGQLAVRTCVDLVHKRPVPGRVVAPIALIDAGNVDRALAVFPQPLPSAANVPSAGK